MSSKNLDLNDIVSNFNKDVKKFSELLESLLNHKQQIQAHINEMKNIDDLKSMADHAELNFKSEWDIITKSTKSIEQQLNEIYSQAYKTGSQIDKNKSSETNINTTESKETSRDETSNRIDKKIPEKQLNNDVTVGRNPVADINDPINSDLRTDSDKEFVENIGDMKNNLSDKDRNLNIAVDDEVKIEANIEGDASTNNEKGPKPGLIRVVPLQNLLSSPQKRSHTSPTFPWVISDSDDETNAAVSKNKSKENVLELSDSNDENLQQIKKSGSSTNKIKSGPRRKITPLRNKSEKIQTKDIEESIAMNCEKSNENSAASCFSTIHLNPSSDSETSCKIKKELYATDNRNSNPNSSCESQDIVPVNGTSTYSFTLLSKLLHKKENEKSEPTSSALLRQFFRKKCVVRLKRISLTANNVKLDNPKRVKNRMQINSSNQRKTKIKIMASDSDSEIETTRHSLINSDKDNNSASEKEIVPVRKKRIFQSKQKKDSDSDWNCQESNRKVTTARKKRKVLQPSSGSSNGSDDEDGDSKQRKKIRKVINEKNLDDGTKKATQEEEERKKRIEERQKVYNKIYIKPENVEVDELILDFDEETKKPLLKVDDGLMKKLKPHQVNGVKFMWDACFETLKDCKEKPGSGCILAHCMGLGKTMQIVTLSHTLLTNYEATNIERVLVISPLSTLNNWAREFIHWMNFAKNKNVEVYDMSKYKDKNTRVFKLEEWFNEGGVCIVGYDMYRILSNEKTKGLRKKQKESLQKSLVDPGPDVVICDEGHLLKNEKTSLSQAVTKMHTKRRIVLTGTPLQNNLKEYYCMIQFIKPNLLGTYKEYLNRFVNPISNGQYTDSTPRDIRLMKHRSHILHKMLEACIQRRDYSVLAPYLPPKHEYVVFCTMSEKQKEIYEHYMTKQRDTISESSGVPGKGAKLFQDFQNLRRIWTHPMNLRVNSDTVIKKKMAQYDSEESMKDFVVEDSEDSTSSDSESSSSFVEAETNESKSVRSRNTRAQRDFSDNECMETAVKEDPSEWWTQFVEDLDLNNINHSPKLVLLMTLLQRCEEIGDKVLVFSQSLQSLDVIEHFLSLIDKKTRGQEVEADVADFKGFWQPGADYFRLDGSRTVENRESMCKSFNNVANLRARLFLISTRAGGLGINLVAANRVVIFDVSWNPSHDTQSIFRVYRFGQTKPCYIYRLIALGTMEQKVYERQVAKQATAKRVIDEQQISRHYNQSDLQELYSYELEPSIPRQIPILPKDRLFAELLSNYEKLVFKYHEHDSLLENEDSENLSEEERKAAWDEYEAEKTRPPQAAMQYMPYERQNLSENYGNPAGTVTSNKIYGFRSDILLRLLNMKGCQDHPELTSRQVVQLVPGYLQRLYIEMNNDNPTLYMELLELHKSLEAPNGMYMNPLLFANQTPAPAPGPAPYRAPYAQMHPSTSNFNSSEVYEVD
ncbi:transcriptional regulator ATRX homolog isoform X2 [Eupeodes corollae]|nr:transcriptional regulator ATRX homolog isoform X2 [Eupeodes corollae]